MAKTYFQVSIYSNMFDDLVIAWLEVFSHGEGIKLFMFALAA